MKTLIARSTGGPSVLQVVDQPEQAVGPRDVRITVEAAGLNRIDLSVRAGYLVDAGLLAPADQYHFGWDVAGTVESVGATVTRFRAGDAVIGLRDLLSAPGTHAELVVLDESAVAPAPATLDAVSAAALPLGVLTADGALRASGASRGDSLLVTGASGVVGRHVVELAVLHGVDVVAQARPGDTESLRAAGARHVISAGTHVAHAARRMHAGGVDTVIDCANLAIVAHDALRSGGTFVTLVRPFAPPPLRGTVVTVHEAHADGERLAELGDLVDKGAVTVRVAGTYPLHEAAAAHERLAGGGVKGRLVLIP